MATIINGSTGVSQIQDDKVTEDKLNNNKTMIEETKQWL